MVIIKIMYIYNIKNYTQSASLLSYENINNKITFIIIGTSIEKKKDVKISDSNLFCQGQDILQQHLFEFLFIFFFSYSSVKINFLLLHYLL